METVALVYATRCGQTRKIIDRMQRALAEAGCAVVAVDARRRRAVLPAGVDGVVVGGPIYLRRFPAVLRRWIRRHLGTLQQVRSALFTVSLNAADARGAARSADDDALRGILAATGWTPDLVASFAGALKYRSYPWLLRLLMRRISAEAGGDTDTSRDFEYTDWDAVDAFLRAVLGSDRGSRFALVHRLPDVAAAGSRRHVESA